MKNLLAFLSLFFLLSIYFNLLPIIFSMSDVIRMVHILLFFPLAYLLAKQFHLRGLDMYGLVRFKGWRKNLLLGYLTGFVAWAVLFSMYLYFGKLEFQGIKGINDSMLSLVVILFAFGTGSIINDMIVRGLVFYHFKNRVPILVLFSLTLVFYAFDDIWYAGFTIQNTIFSLVLGLSLTYAFYKTNSIWANTGIHFGLNTVYGLFYGVTGKAGDGIFVVTQNQSIASWIGWISTLIAFLMFIVVLITIKFYSRNNNEIRGKA
ncbi:MULTISPECIES: CPBP family intramembrane glutamic endopeptidase [Mesobacillus]|uniref:CPBP family intramembrane metalloprotease n=1 Tax=Mesobacillus selenatarsenatis TaxID=388741 RepID=A0A846TLJ0_9BACI|nr:MULTISPECIES: CPBP family intramembrane glutamic endopeptidase [Mesobacillus]NKE07649.1 CPBP family intramembrane metalloprotease [Mesobacillus selenatarsenatis]